MQIIELDVKNFRGIKNISLKNLKKTVVIAGPNGCGKSCIFEALRLIKASYGQYDRNELQCFIDDHSLRKGNQVDYAPIFRNKNTPIYISCTIKLEDHEKNCILSNINFYIEKHIISKFYPNNFSDFLINHTLPTGSNELISTEKAKIIPILQAQLTENSFRAELTLPPKGFIQTVENTALSIIFSEMNSESIGRIEYIPSNRTYAKSMIQSINMDMNQHFHQKAIQGISGRADRFNNIVSEMATSYLKSLVLKDLGRDIKDEKFFEDSIKELFEKFIPGKSFKGASIGQNQNLCFNVKTDDGFEHDINELSSGEKEVLFAYVDLYQSGLKNSVVLIDEPEMHLNPRLVKMLPDFYREKIGEHFENQLFLVTHSDAILAAAINDENYSVYHFIPATQVKDNEPQSFLLSHVNNSEKVLYEIVGLSTYKPNNKILIVESKNSEFDASVLKHLFPELAAKSNIISAGSKTDVSKMHDSMTHLQEDGSLRGKIFSISDPDDKIWEENQQPQENYFLWDRYHIENYFLDSEIMFNIYSDRNTISKFKKFKSSEEIEEKLKEYAKEITAELTSKKTQTWLHNGLRSGIKIHLDTLAEDMIKSCDKVYSFKSNEFSEEKIKEEHESNKKLFNKYIEDGTWKMTIPGRRILQKITNDFDMPYSDLINTIIAEMKKQDKIPAEMQKIIKRILES